MSWLYDPNGRAYGSEYANAIHRNSKGKLKDKKRKKLLAKLFSQRFISLKGFRQVHMRYMSSRELELYRLYTGKAWTGGKIPARTSWLDYV